MNLFRRFVLSWLLIGVLPAAAQRSEQLGESHMGRVTDWSSRHVVVSGALSADNLEAARNEPRILFHLAERNLVRNEAPADSTPFADTDEADTAADILEGWRFRERRSRSLKRDWSLSLGAGAVAQSKFPAKYGFSITATPSCSNDFVVFGLNVTGATGGQANLVGVTNLYSGTGGFCTSGPTVNWAYNGSTAGGKVLTSPTISLDGTKIAYVESASGSSVFHVLTWFAGQGTSATASAGPAVPPNCTVSATSVPTSSCLKSVIYSSTASTTLADAWVDYATDKGFVASDDGKISRISCVFKCALNAQPAIDWTYTLPVAGTGGAQPVPNSPVYNYATGQLFVGDQLGELWVINAAVSTPTLGAGPIMIGGGGCTTAHPPGRTGTGTNCTATGTAYGIPDAVIVDSTSGRIYAFSGNNGKNAVVAQLTMSLTSEVAVPIGESGVNIYSGAFDNEYWGTTPSTGELFVCGTDPTATYPYLYWIGFSSYPTMNSAATDSVYELDEPNIPCTPLTEFYNPNLNLGGVTGDHDLLMGGLVSSTYGYLVTFDISSGSPTLLDDASYPGGISAIIVDNDSLDGQASSMYFGTLTGNTAVKLTQLNLQ